MTDLDKEWNSLLEEINHLFQKAETNTLRFMKAVVNNSLDLSKMYSGETYPKSVDINYINFFETNRDLILEIYKKKCREDEKLLNNLKNDDDRREFAEEQIAREVFSIESSHIWALFKNEKNNWIPKRKWELKNE